MRISRSTRLSQPKWSSADDALLEPYLRLPPSQQVALLELLPNRTIKGIATRIQVLRRVKRIKTLEHRWAKAEQEILQRNYKGTKTNYAYIASLLLGRTEVAIKSYCSNMRHKLEAELFEVIDEPTFNPGNISCLSCQRPFDSWDKKRNRICDPCTSSNGHMNDTIHSIRT